MGGGDGVNPPTGNEDGPTTLVGRGRPPHETLVRIKKYFLLEIIVFLYERCILFYILFGLKLNLYVYIKYV